MCEQTFYLGAQAATSLSRTRRKRTTTAPRIMRARKLQHAMLVGVDVCGMQTLYIQWVCPTGVMLVTVQLLQHMDVPVASSACHWLEASSKSMSIGESFER